MEEEIAKFGKVFYYDYLNYHFALYIYDGDDETIYLSNVKVDAETRGKSLEIKSLKLLKEKRVNEMSASFV